MTVDTSLLLNGRSVAFAPGETILDVATREGVEIPTLCHDTRLDPVGACRMCLVEVEGERRMPAACMARAHEGMEVCTESPRIGRHRRTLLALYLCEREGVEARAGDELLELAARYDAPKDWGSLKIHRAGRPNDRNRYVHFDPERCILCARCTRYCEEVEGVSAIALSARGAETTISTPDERSLLDTTCELCGGCIDVCPTGAMTEKLPRSTGEQPQPPLDSVRTTCNYCGVGCQMDLLVDRAANGGRGRVVKVASPPPGTTTNDGNLCVKGRFAYEFIDHTDRLSQPLVRGADGALREASWPDALSAAAAGLQAVRQRHGPDALGFVSSSRCTMEENYLVQKLARSVFGTNNVHQCAAT
jgi:predicted molibdopterin-dependent oxidoreductase YjgC